MTRVTPSLAVLLSPPPDALDNPGGEDVCCLAWAGC